MSIISSLKKKFSKSEKKIAKTEEVKPIIEKEDLQVLEPKEVKAPVVPDKVISEKKSLKVKKEPVKPASGSGFSISDLQKKFDEKAASKGVSIDDLQNSLDSESELPKNGASNNSDFQPLLVSRFDDLVDEGGIELGNNIMVSGGTGVGKSTFCLQALYNNALKGKRGLYISFEEDVTNLKRHMKKNYNWDFEKLEAKGLVKFVQIDPFSISRRVESELAKERGELLIQIKGVLDIIPAKFNPAIIVVDSLSALGAAFLDNIESYRLYLSSFLKRLASQKSINIVLSETEQNPDRYSRSGIEEFLVDGVIVLYNIRSQQVRQKAIEILKLRCSNHVKKLIPYVISSKGLEIFPEGKIFL
ncbi:MAG TPA: ATPase domain-containing protein [Candidatus Nanoarchaeia archaeon]|nr:ATPase domain-containing protein [Candidatus Nanoarchaeia archaeon]